MQLRALCCMLRASCQAAAVYMTYIAIMESVTCANLTHDAAMSDVHTQQKRRWTGLTSDLPHIPVIVANTIQHSVLSAETPMRIKMQPMDTCLTRYRTQQV